MESNPYDNNIRNITEISKDFQVDIPCKIPSLNSSTDKSLFQSPKIKSNKIRPLSGFINNNYNYIAKGTNFEKQMKRLNKEELNNIFGNSWNKKAGNINKNKKKIIKNYLGENLKIKYKNNNQVNKNKEEVKVSNINEQKSKKNLKIELNENNFEKNKFRIKNSFNRPLSTNPNNIRKNHRKEKDAWIPKGYLAYETSIINSHKINNNRPYNIKEVKQKANSSDIFFLRPKSEKEYNKVEEYKNKSKSKHYDIKLGSDIFNAKNDFNNLMKSSELFLFKKNNTPFNSESKSFWVSKISYPTYMNYPSVEYNILNPSKKSNTKTREKIYKECFEKNKNINPIYKQKSIGSYDDITKVGINRNIEYNNFINKESKIFYKQNNLCTSLSDMHNNYQNIVSKPFFTQINNNIYT
jgi:hypothetical protein